jgi:hypothetical protein
MILNVACKHLSLWDYLKLEMKFDNFCSVNGNKEKNRIAFLTMA